MAYPDVFFTMLNLFSSFTDDNMMPQAITLHDEFIIILSQYIIFSSGRYTFRASSRFLPLPPHPPKAYFIHSTWSQNTENKKNRP